jgi:hypothetical protein
MLRRILITLAAATATLALATAPAGAGIGNFEVYADPGFQGTHASVPSTTVDDYINACVLVSTLTSSSPATAGSTDNDTSFDIKIYSASGCSGLITTVSAHSSWSSPNSVRAVSAFVVQPSS